MDLICRCPLVTVFLWTNSDTLLFFFTRICGLLATRGGYLTSYFLVFILRCDYISPVTTSCKNEIYFRCKNCHLENKDTNIPCRRANQISCFTPLKNYWKELEQGGPLIGWCLIPNFLLLLYLATNFRMVPKLSLAQTCSHTILQNAH